MTKQNRKVRFYEGDGTPFRSIKPDRNAPCGCGSGRKSKVCCGVEVKYYHSKPPPKADLNVWIEKIKLD